MRRLWTFPIFLFSTLLLAGLSWGEPCKEALELAGTAETSRDEAQVRETEAQMLSLCPDGAAGHYVTALQLERVGTIDGAIAEYRKALQLESSFPVASGNLGLLYSQKGMIDEASVELARGLSGAPKPAYHKAMARILAIRKIYPLAVYHYTEAGRKLTSDAGINIGLAEIYRTTGKPDQALEEYRKALNTEPDNGAAHIGIATIHLARNDQDNALEQLKKAETGSPQNREIHLMLASIYEKKGDKKSAEYHYLLGGKGKGTASTTAPQKMPGDIVLSGDPAKDIESIKAAIRDQPESSTLYDKLGALYRVAGKDDDAIAAYKEAVHLKGFPLHQLYIINFTALHFWDCSHPFIQSAS